MDASPAQKDKKNQDDKPDTDALMSQANKAADTQTHIQTPPLKNTPQEPPDQEPVTNKKPSKNILPVIIVIFLIFLIAGQIAFILSARMPGLFASIPIINQYINTPAPTPETSPAPTPDAASQISPASSVSQSHTLFGLNLIKHLSIQAPKQNTVISPTSLAMALTITTLGANTDTRNEMIKTLTLPAISNSQISSQSSELITNLQESDPQVTMEIANSLFINKEAAISPEFINQAKKHFNSHVQNIDFADSQAANTINAWVQKNTAWKITKIIDPPIPAGVMMYIINALYFNGTWTYEFDPNQSQQRSFTLRSGEEITTDTMMQSRDNFEYFENNEFQAISLPYGENKKISMFIFLPKQSLDSMLGHLNLDNWNTWMNSFNPKKGTLIMPKFKTEYEKQLNNDLIHLGMKKAFDIDQADFSLMSQMPLYISKVIHKTVIEVDEKGTEAAAVTAVEIGITSAGTKSDQFYMEINKPFLFAIVDNKSQEIVFMGTIWNPLNGSQE